jgi:hypothetical protein
MSEREITSIQHLRLTLDRTSWTDDLSQFSKQCQQMKRLAKNHFVNYGRVPKDVRDRMARLLMEIREV